MFKINYLRNVPLVIARNESQKPITHFMNMLKEFAENQQSSPFKKTLFTSLTMDSDRITLCKEARSKEEKLEDLFGNLKAITKQNFEEGIIVSPEISIDEGTKSYLNKLETEIEKELLSFLRSSTLKDTVENLINSHTGTAQALRNTFNPLKGKESKIDNIKRFLLSLNNHDLSHKFSNLIVQYKFFIKNLQEDIQEKIEKLNFETLDEWVLYSQNPRLDSQEGYKTLTGNIIGTSDIFNQCIQNNSHITQIRTSSYALIFDRDIRSSGANFILAAPLWNIVQKTTIDLSGLDMLEPRKEVTKSPGQNGRAGKPGYSGGNFYGQYNTIKNPKLRCVQVSVKRWVFF